MTDKKLRISSGAVMPRARIDTINVNNETFRLTSPIEIAASIDENGNFNIDSGEFDIYVSEPTFSAAVDVFMSWLEFSYEQYAFESDGNLTQDAVEYKNKLLSYIKSE